MISMKKKRSDMKYLVMFFIMFSVSCGIVPEDERYVTDESINDSSDNLTASLSYPPPRGR